jgi:site-specific DNA recombinase
VECEPIISEELWNQVNQIIEEQLKSWKKPGKPPVHLFSGLAHCMCGHKMYVRNQSSKYFCRKCSNKIPIEDLSKIVHQELRVFFTEPKRVAHHLREADRNLAEKQAMLDAHQQELQKVRDEMTRTHRLYVEEQITAQGFGQFYKPAEERLNQLVLELPKLQAEVDYLKVNKLSADDILHEAGTLYDRWPSLPPEDQRKIVECLIEKIVIGDGEIDITLSHLPSSEEVCKNQQRLGLG